MCLSPSVAAPKLKASSVLSKIKWRWCPTPWRLVLGISLHLGLCVSHVLRWTLPLKNERPSTCCSPKLIRLHLLESCCNSISLQLQESTCCTSKAQGSQQLVFLWAVTCFLDAAWCSNSNHVLYAPLLLFLVTCSLMQNGAHLFSIFGRCWNA